MHPSHCLLANLSSNGTLVNGNRVDEVSLTDGDEIRVSQGTTLRIHVVAPEPVSMPDPQPEASSATEDAFRETVPIPANFGETTFHADDFSRQPVIDPDRLLSPCSVVVVSGPLAGRTMDLQEGRPLLIGRLPECDLSIQYDPAMSRRQCQLAFVPPDCFLTNISVNGSFVNDRRVDGEAKLTDGDEIEIGSNTILRIHIRPDCDEPGSEAVNMSEAASVISMSRSECPNGLVRLSFDAEPQRLAVFSLLLARGRQSCAVLDVNKSGVTLPEDITEPDYLMDWLPPQAANQISPVLIRPADTREFGAILDDASGTDAYVLMFSKQNIEDFDGSLRSLAKFNPATGAENSAQALFGYWWPSILTSILEHSPKEALQKMTSDIDGFLVEDVDGEGWRLFATAGFAQFVEQQETVEVTADSSES